MESIISLLGFVALTSLVAMIVLILNRARRGEKVSTDKDWRLFFGEPKADVFTARYAIKLVGVFVAYAFIGVIEYMILIPYGFTWYILGTAVTALVILPLTSRILR